MENICVHGDSSQGYVIALIIPSVQAIKELSTSMGIQADDLNELCSNVELVNQVTKELAAYGRKSGLLNLEIPRKIKLCSEQWTADNGLVTAALKTRRKQVKDFYSKDIDRMYKSS